MNLFTFLYFCGKINSFGESLVRFTLNARRDELGIDDAEVAQCVNDLEWSFMKKAIQQTPRRSTGKL